MTDKSREAFEALCKIEGLSIAKNSEPVCYSSAKTRLCELFWQSGRASMREESAIYAPAEPTRWISVNDKLPPARVKVLMCRSHGERDLAIYDSGRYTPPWRYADDQSESIRDVIYWMHIPLPPAIDAIREIEA